MSERPGLKAILKINADCLRAALCGGLAWGFWQVYLAGVLMFGFFAVIFAVGLIKWTVIALFGIGKLILQQRKWARYKAQGAAPKADPMARDADLRAKGLLK